MTWYTLTTTEFVPEPQGLSVSRLKTGTIGWAILAGVVAAWDTWGPETLSSAYWRGLDNKVARPMVLFATGWTLSHLVARRPQRMLVRW